MFRGSIVTFFTVIAAPLIETWKKGCDGTGSAASGFVSTVASFLGSTTIAASSSSRPPSEPDATGKPCDTVSAEQATMIVAKKEEAMERVVLKARRMVQPWTHLTP